jgi:hypothetical protein
LARVELVKSTVGDSALLVGGAAGVYRTRFATSPGTDPVWTEFGAGLPNAQVTIVRYETADAGDPNDDFLLVSTLGRGVWTVPTTDLSTQSRLQIDGGAGDDEFDLIRNANNPLLFDVTVNGTPQGTFQLGNIERIEVNGLGGEDRLTIDTTNGILPGPTIHFAGGADDDTIELTGPSTAGLMGSSRSGRPARRKSSLTPTSRYCLPSHRRRAQSRTSWRVFATGWKTRRAGRVG